MRNRNNKSKQIKTQREIQTRSAKREATKKDEIEMKRLNQTK